MTLKFNTASKGNIATYPPTTSWTSKTSFPPLMEILKKFLATKMKKTLAIISVLASLALLASCSSAKDKTTKLINDTETSVNNVTSKVSETVQDIQTATKKIEEAKNAVSEISK